MNVNEYLEKMTIIQRKLLEYIDDEDASNIEDKFNNFKDLLFKTKIQDNKYELKSFLYLLLNISNNHHRTDNFFNKILKILELFEDDLRKCFSNSELFHIFKSNKRIFLFLIEEKIMNFDKFIAKKISNDIFFNSKYPLYFQPEIGPFIKKEWFTKYEKDENNLFFELQKEIPDDFYEKRKIGENDNFICGLIRQDLLDDFIVYVNENNYPLNSTINRSIYETNHLLLKNKKTTLIEYAAFFGSIKIFNYLRLNKILLMPSLWEYAIHGNNAEIIQILEEKHIELPVYKSYKQIFKESIKCHHIDIAYYIQNNYLENKNSNNIWIDGIKYHNFIFIENDKINESSFNYLCKYDYYILVFILLSTNDIDINNNTIYEINFFDSIQCINIYTIQNNIIK